MLGALATHARKPIYCHSAVTPINNCYRAQGIQLAPTKCLSSLNGNETLKGELFLVPQAFLKTAQAAFLGEGVETAFASGWMAKATSEFQRGFDRGFIMSDHADWNDLLKTVCETGAKRVYVQHRGHGALVRHLRKLGIMAFPQSELLLKDGAQLSLF